METPLEAALRADPEKLNLEKKRQRSQQMCGQKIDPEKICIYGEV